MLKSLIDDYQHAPLDFEKSVERWKAPPFSGLGYFSTTEMLKKTDDEIRVIVQDVERIRYAGGEGTAWRSGMKLDATSGKTVLDFGCGMGIDALQLAKAGNRIILADIVPANIEFSVKVLELFGYQAAGKVNVSGEPPFFECGSFDVFYSVVALSFTPRIRGILQRAIEISPSAAIRLMLYSDKSWKNITGANPDPESIVIDHKKNGEYIAGMDQGSQYCDWYSTEKLANIVDDILNIDSHRYVGEVFSVFELTKIEKKTYSRSEVTVEIKPKPKKKAAPKKAKPKSKKKKATRRKS
jgi:SAM-dependent methyltransferase